MSMSDNHQEGPPSRRQSNRFGVDERSMDHNNPHDIFWVKYGDFIFWPRSLNDFELGEIICDEEAQCVPYNNERKNEMIKTGLIELKSQSLVIFKDQVLEAEGLFTSSCDEQASFFQQVFNDNNINNGSDDISDIQLPPSPPPPSQPAKKSAKRSIHGNKYSYPRPGVNGNSSSSSSTSMPKLYSVAEDNQNHVNNNNHQHQSHIEERMDLVDSANKERLLAMELDGFKLKNFILNEEKKKLTNQIADMTWSHKEELDKQTKSNLLLSSRVKYLDEQVLKVTETNSYLERELAELKSNPNPKSEDQKYEAKLKLKSEEINRKNAIIRDMKEHLAKEFEKLLPPDIEID